MAFPQHNLLKKKAREGSLISSSVLRSSRSLYLSMGIRQAECRWKSVLILFVSYGTQ